MLKEEKEHKKEEEKEDSSTSSNNEVDHDDLFDIIKKANKGLAGSVRTSKDTTKTLTKQGHSLKKSLHKKKNIRDSIGKDEKTVQNINAEGHVVVVKSSFFDKVKGFFSGKTWHEEAVNQSAEKEEKKAEKYSDEEDDEFSSEESRVAEDLESTGSDVSDELEKTLAGLQSLRRSVHFQTQKIKSQRHAAKEMQILDKDTTERAKQLEEEAKHIK